MSLLKMTILSFDKTGSKQLTALPQVYIVMFNPTSYKLEYKVNYDTNQPDGSDGKAAPVKNIEPQQYSFDFLIDGTGAAGYKREVLLDVESFKKTVGYDKKIGNGKGSVRYLILLWGSMMLKCSIESISVNYTLFNSAGIPLRATISATFKERKDDPDDFTKAMDDFFESDPVKDGLSVANIAFQAFNGVSQTIAIAEANDLNSIREKVTASSIKLPS
jgi:hypothetical protein